MFIDTWYLLKNTSELAGYFNTVLLMLNVKAGKLSTPTFKVFGLTRQGNRTQVYTDYEAETS